VIDSLDNPMATENNYNQFNQVNGKVQIFVKGRDNEATIGKESSTSENLGSSGNLKQGNGISRDWEGHHLLNEVSNGGTVSSLFSILSVFTEELDLPAKANTSTKSQAGKFHHDSS
jgi:lysophospholipid hydrolase